MPSLFALQTYLRNCDKAEQILSVSSVHDLAGDDFPNEAQECSFWDNDATRSKAWREAGFIVGSRDWPAKILRFARIDGLAESATPFQPENELAPAPFDSLSLANQFSNPLIGVWHGKIKPKNARMHLPTAREPVCAASMQTGQLLLGFDFIMKSALGYSVAPRFSSDRPQNLALPLLISEATNQAIVDECRGGKLNGVGDPAYMYQLLFTRDGVQELQTPAKVASEAGNIFRNGGVTRPASELLAVAKAHDLTIVTNEVTIQIAANRLGINVLDF